MRKSYSPLLAKAWYIAKYGKGLKILTPKQTLKGLPVALAQVKAGNTYENVINEICQLIHFLYWAKEITKKV